MFSVGPFLQGLVCIRAVARRDSPIGVHLVVCPIYMLEFSDLLDVDEASRLRALPGGEAGVDTL